MNPNYKLNDDGEYAFIPPFLRTGYNYDTDQASIDSGLACLDATKTQQNQAEDADINNIVGKFIKTGELPTTGRLPSFEDFGEPVDYQTALNAVMAAEDAFMDLPAQIRDRFQNDPAQFLAFCEDESNLPEAQKMGLLGREAALLASGQDSSGGTPLAGGAEPSKAV